MILSSLGTPELPSKVLRSLMEEIGSPQRPHALRWLLRVLVEVYPQLISPVHILWNQQSLSTSYCNSPVTSAGSSCHF